MRANPPASAGPAPSSGRRPARHSEAAFVNLYPTFLDIASSPAFVHGLEGNGCAEHFLCTLKESLLWVERFDMIKGLRRALLPISRRLQLDVADQAAWFSGIGPIRAAGFSFMGLSAQDSTRCVTTCERYTFASIRDTSSICSLATASKTGFPQRLHSALRRSPIYRSFDMPKSCNDSSRRDRGGPRRLIIRA